MARITVDDCLKNIPNRFEMTLAAAIRARQLARGHSSVFENPRNKFAVTALREIAAGHVTRDILSKLEA